MKFKETILEMIEENIKGKTEFDKLVDFTKNPFEKLRIRQDEAVCRKYIKKNASGELEFEKGQQIPCMIQLKSASVMRDIIAYMMSEEERYE